MKVGWRNVALQEVADIERDIIDPSAITDGTTYIGLENIETGGLFVNVRSVTSGELASTKFTFTDKHILYGKLRPYLIKIARPTFSGICSTDILPILPRPELDRDYLSYFLRQPSMVDLATSRSTGANLPRLSPKILAEFSIPLPPIAQQKRIAAILDKAEELRGLRRQALEALDAIAQSIFLEMFGDPTTNPKGWIVTPMGKLFAESPIFGSMIPPVSEPLTWLSLRVGNIQNWQLDLNDKKYIELPDNLIERYVLQEGDLLMARAIASVDHLGKCIIVYPNNQKWAFDSHLMRLRLSKDLAEPEFIRALLMTPGGRILFLGSSRKSTVQFNINTKEIAALRLPIPPIELQQEFARRVEAIEQLKTTHRQSLTQLNALFASLQHRAFRGEL